MVVKFDSKTLIKAKSYFALHGSIIACANETKVHHTTVSRVVKNGEGTERVVNAITSYLKTV